MKPRTTIRFCPGCIGRRLQASTSPCLRCGREWAPNRNPEQFVTRLTRWLLRPLGWFTHTLTIATALCCLWAATTHGPDFLFAIVIAWLCLFIVVIWLGRALVRFMVAAFFRRGGWAYPGWRNWLVAPVAALLVASLIQLDVPMRIAFLISRPAMTRLAQRTLKLSPRVKPPNDVRVGRYRATNIRRVHGGVRFNVADNGFIDADYFGFAYFPEWKPPPTSQYDPENTGYRHQGTSYRHLNGNWYSFHEFVKF